jgi:DNA polymerase beta
MSEDFIIGCCGSYRRGRDRSGDADSLLVHKKLKTKEDIKKYEEVHGSVLSIFINKLKELNFISDSLTDGGSTKYMGLCRLKSTSKNKYTLYRRLDVRFVPYNSYGAALLYFTGSKDHNVIMRNQAISMGLTLSEYGLFKGKKKDQKEQIPTISEEDVFKILKMEYKNPKERDI